MPARSGDWKNVHRRLRRWYESGVTERIFRHLAADHDNEYMMTDAIHFKVHRTAVSLQKRAFPRHIGRTKGGLNSNLHAICDCQGRPVRVHLIAGQ
ncbi:transposase [Acetobacter musti]|uniref:Transposase n=1 Tax=Acetobacter musti TaxID=864732 RepID=A0ABX0JJS3_9PROT|nr:transposase [Acetobacter musti]